MASEHKLRSVPRYVLHQLIKTELINVQHSTQSRLASLQMSHLLKDILSTEQVYKMLLLKVAGLLAIGGMMHHRSLL